MTEGDAANPAQMTVRRFEHAEGLASRGIPKTCEAILVSSSKEAAIRAEHHGLTCRNGQERRFCFTRHGRGRATGVPAPGAIHLRPDNLGAAENGAVKGSPA